MSYKVIAGADCYGIATDAAGAKAIIDMHKNTKNGYKKDTKASALDFRVEQGPTEYPTNKPPASLNYKPGRYPSTGEIR